MARARRYQGSVFETGALMNIAILCYHRLGGSGILAHDLGAALAKTGRHSVHFVGLEPPFRYLDNDNENVWFHKIELKEYPVFVYPPYTLSLASQLASIIDNNDIDVVHSHYAIPHAVAAILAGNIAKRKIRTVTTLHGTDITLIGSHPTFKNITRYTIEESDVVTAVSSFLKDRTQEVLGINGDKIEVVYNFVDRDCFNPDLKYWCCHKPDPNRKIIAHASNLRPVKAPLDVIKLFAAISKATSFETELWVIGDGPMQSKMMDLCRELKIKGKVKFLGVRTDLGRILTCCDLFLLPSKEESFGLAALEAMACGVPVLASRAGGLPEVIKHDVSGCLMNVGDIETGTILGKRLLEDQGFCDSVINEGIRTAFEGFRQADVLKSYEALYRG